ncbi:EpsG family protein [Pluralibacter gergoviae]|uniref:EpsG family protein n=1 Tax=Pluralibacter gergoviae TaxID=61647 RepID=UPI00190A3EC2|nr:EpsG family protein [Pluralibacter gergoviae]EMD1656846.1 EpsG family protein [Pluralibacter gergoviae]MBK4118580.1 EpsG family protein [Pluralibacter gergoviae]
MGKAALSKYTLFSILFILILIYKVYSIDLVSDNLNYYNVYNNIENDSMPFKFEFILSLLMYISNFIGMDFYIFTFIKVITFLPIIIIVDRNISKKNNIYSYLFLFTFISPPMIGTLIFLARQSLSLEVFLLVTTIKSFNKRILLIVIMFFCHMGSILWVPILLGYKKLFTVLNSKLFWLLSLLILAGAVITGMDLTRLVIQYLATFNNLPGFIMSNLARKRDFYVLHELTEFDTLSILNTIVSVIPVVFFILFVSLKKIENFTVHCLCALYSLSFFLFSLFYNNSIFATRVGFISYFFGVQYLFLFIYLVYLIKNNVYKKDS